MCYTQAAAVAKPATASPVNPPPQPELASQLQQPEVFAAAILAPAVPESVTAPISDALDHGKENGVAPAADTIAEQVR